MSSCHDPIHPVVPAAPFSVKRSSHRISCTCQHGQTHFLPRHISTLCQKHTATRQRATTAPQCKHRAANQATARRTCTLPTLQSISVWWPAEPRQNPLLCYNTLATISHSWPIRGHQRSTSRNPCWPHMCPGRRVVRAASTHRGAKQPFLATLGSSSKQCSAVRDAQLCSGYQCKHHPNRLLEREVSLIFIVIGNVYPISTRRKGTSRRIG